MNCDDIYSVSGDTKAKFGGYDNEMAKIYREKYQNRNAPNTGYKAIRSLPKVEGDQARGGVAEGEQPQIASKTRSSVNMGYFPDKWNCSEAKRANKKLTKIYEQPIDSYDRRKIRENKTEMVQT